MMFRCHQLSRSSNPLFYKNCCIYLLYLLRTLQVSINLYIRSHPNPSLILISILSKSYTTYLCQAMSTSCILIRIPNSIYPVPPITPHNHHGRSNQGKGLAYLPLYFLHFFPLIYMSSSYHASHIQILVLSSLSLS